MSGWDADANLRVWLITLVAALAIVLGVVGCHNQLDDTCIAQPTRCSSR